jgi:hypothetical protein
MTKHAIFRRDDRLWPAWTRGHRRSRDYPPRSHLPRSLGRYSNISFIHEIVDITADILAEAALPEIPAGGADLQANRFDHARDLRKHESV